jgi:c-di-GMP-binding flagellar brake protein YcgR
MTFDINDDPQGLSRYKIHARREIINLLRNIGQRNQLVRMQANRGVDSVVTSILDVDESNGVVIIDCAPGQTTNERLLRSDDISFEAVLDNIRILFSALKLESCDHEGRAALSFEIPGSVIRLQRREFYRVPTPVTTPVKCTIPVPGETGKPVTAVVLSLMNVSAGGISVTDETKQISPDFSADLPNCRIELPGSPVTVTLRLRNSQDLSLSNGKSVRRLGFMFVNPSTAIEALIQRYITKLEREQNARKTGMG